MSNIDFSEFSGAVSSQIDTSAPYANMCLEKLRPSLVWTARHMESGAFPDCKFLLKGSYGAAVEAVSLVSFGLVRPAILSLRSHYELSLQFLFYKDHPVELRNVKAYRTQPNLPGVNKKYLKDNFPKFEDRFKKLAKVKTRTDDDCYSVLSGIAHGTAINSISSATKPNELIESANTVSQSVNVFRDVGENLCDIHVSCFENNWLSLPEPTKQSLTARFVDNNPSSELDF